MNIVEFWSYWYHEFPEYLQKHIKDGATIFFGFLTQAVEIEPDHYGGTDREYYYSVSDGTFHTWLRHWDGGNFTAQRCYNDEIITIDQMIDLLEEKRRSALNNDLSPQDVKTVEDSFALIKKWMIMLDEGSIPA